jgi:hypothetical protein
VLHQGCTHERIGKSSQRREGEVKVEASFAPTNDHGRYQNNHIINGSVVYAHNEGETSRHEAHGESFDLEIVVY